MARQKVLIGLPHSRMMEDDEDEITLRLMSEKASYDATFVHTIEDLKTAMAEARHSSPFFAQTCQPTKKQNTLTTNGGPTDSILIVTSTTSKENAILPIE